MVDLPCTVLIIALRRGHLKDHQTLDSLLQGKEHTIRWKKDAEDLPFFLLSQPRGTGLIAGSPMNYSAGRYFFQKTSVDCGLGGNFFRSRVI
jgi:hypothetical protein